jgi:hypothetical protein
MSRIQERVTVPATAPPAVAQQDLAVAAAASRGRSW